MLFKNYYIIIKIGDNMYKITDGNNACADMSYNFIETAFIYPITPSSPMSSRIDELKNSNVKNLFNDSVDLVEMQSEAGAAGALHGSLISGSLSSTYTSSQGLLLMIPNMYKIAGEMLPGVIHVASRSLSTHALSIEGDHQDIYATRQTGFCMLASSNPQDAYNLSLVAHVSAIENSLPFLHFFDGFRTSHEINKIKYLHEEQIKSFINYEKINQYKKNSLNIGNTISKGMAETSDTYFQITESRNKDYNKVADSVENIMNKLNNLAGTNYEPFNYYGSENAKYVIVAMGSVCDTIKKVIDNSNNQYGLIEVHLYRPFSIKHLLAKIPETTKKIAVLDRTKEQGSIGEPLYLDVLASLKNTDIKVYGGRYGLSGKDTLPSDIYGIFDMLENAPKDNFTIGINDDLTNTSIPKKEIIIKDNYEEIKIYGYASDGLISSSKDILKIVGTDKFVQGYFKYDSKKSGGLTESHLRFSEKSINAPYLLTHPKIIVISKDEYLKHYKLFNEIEENGIVLINTNKTDNELSKLFTKDDYNLLKNKNIKIYKIDALSLTRKYNLNNKIGIVLENCLFELLNAKEYIKIQKNNIIERFKTKGQDIINANLNILNDALLGLTLVTLDEFDSQHKLISDKLELIALKRGNELSTSQLEFLKNGTYPGGKYSYKNNIKPDKVPLWIKENCIKCNMCSLICPHGAITPKLYENDFELIIDTNICTGCGHCIKVCPGLKNNKALELSNYYESKENENSSENKFNKFTIKGSQFEKKQFICPGACAGCGETPYIRLLTQLFNGQIIIANATGCSSIYGGSSPYTPHLVPWANSLFEDNAEFAFGINTSYKHQKKKIINIVTDEMNNNSSDVIEKVKEKIDDSLLDYVPERTVWAIGGDGWAYDIGFSGIDHILSSGENIKILVLDTEVYSNTGGQSSKSTRLGAVAEFTNLGKTTPKKDLFKIAMTYNNVYVASVCLGANMMHTIKCFKEAQEHNGPAIIIAYSPCVEQGIKGGMSNSIEQQKLSVECGYNILMRYKDEEIFIDSKQPNFELYDEYLNNEVRYKSLKIKNPELASHILNENMNNAKKRFEYFNKIKN